MSGCWLWLGSHGRKTVYGLHTVMGARMMAHRVSLLLAGVRIPPGHEAAHQCHNRACVNPDHLRPMRHAENAAQNLGRPAVLRSRDQWSGEAHPFAVLTDAVVSEIRESRAAGASLKAIGRRFGLDARRVSKIVRGIAWSRSTGPVQSAGRSCADCEAPHYSRGMCRSHYEQWRRCFRKLRDGQSRIAELESQRATLTFALGHLTQSGGAR